MLQYLEHVISVRETLLPPNLLLIKKGYNSVCLAPVFGVDLVSEE